MKHVLYNQQIGLLRVSISLKEGSDSFARKEERMRPESNEGAADVRVAVGASSREF